MQVVFDAVKFHVRIVAVAPVSDASYPTDVRAALLAAARAELLDHGVGVLSLRAIAARAGVSRATPKWHFGDRAGLLTALAVEGFGQLDDTLRAAVDAVPDAAGRFTALGRAYLDFGLANPELFDLMFRSDALVADAPALVEARRRSFSVLIDVAAQVSGHTAPPGDHPDDLALLGWACAHGLVALVRGGALQVFTGASSPERAAQLARHLADAFTALAARPPS
jgi:AcrR family transcriptional regulator